MRFSKGDKVVIEIKDVVNDLNGPVYVTGNNSLGEVVPLDEVAEPLSKYEEPLKAKLKIQGHNIMELLKENAQLRAENNALSESLDGFKKRVDDMCEVDNGRGRIKGQHEAWELAQKIGCYDCDGGFTGEQREEIFGQKLVPMVFHKHTYPEAAAKVAEWERKQNEICVGDIVRIHEGNDNDLCIICSSSDGYYNAIDEYGAVYPTLYKEMISKTGRHIDVDAWLKQIGVNDNEN